jgi:hypothetical protein
MTMRTFGEIVAVLGVLLGLVFVGWEIRQNTEMMRSQTRADVMQSVLSLIQMERDPAYIRAELKRRTGEELTPEDLYLLENTANATLRVWENTHYQYERGLFIESEFQADLAVWRELMQEPQFSDLWRRSRHTYSESFRAVIDGLIE